MIPEYVKNTKTSGVYQTMQEEWDITGHLSSHSIHQCSDAYEDIQIKKEE